MTLQMNRRQQLQEEIRMWSMVMFLIFIVDLLRERLAMVSNVKYIFYEYMQAFRKIFLYILN